MPILGLIDHDQIKTASQGQPATNHTLNPESKQLILTLLNGAKKHYAWKPKLDDVDFAEALELVDQATAEVTIGV